VRGTNYENPLENALIPEFSPNNHQLSMNSFLQGEIAYPPVSSKTNLSL
jgi:hypothetical protein